MPEIMTRLKRSLENFRLQYPLTDDFGPKISRRFTVLLLVVALLLMLVTAAAQAYEPISVYSRDFTGNTLLWYEYLLGNATSRLGLPQSWACSGSIIQLGDELVTTSGFLMYQLIYYIDGRASIANADQGLLYADDGLQNCSVLMLNLLSFNQAAVSSNQGQAIVSCNTTAGPYFIATTQYPSWNPLGLPQFEPLITPNCTQFLSTSEVPDLKCTMQLWWYVITNLMSLVTVPTPQMSTAMRGLEQQNVTSLRIFYNVMGASGANTPANDLWNLSLGYTLADDNVEKIIDVAYLPNGTIDFDHTPAGDFTQANSLLEPLLSFIQSQTNSTVDIWNVMNALFVGYYWFVLADLSQSSPTTYENSGEFLVPSNFSQPVSHASTNNIILNSTLSKVVFSQIGSNGSDEFAAVLDTVTRYNQTLQDVPRIRRIYLCTLRQRKQFVNLIVSVFGVGFSLIASFYSCSLLVLTRLQEEENIGREDGANNQREDGNERERNGEWERVGEIDRNEDLEEET